MIRAFAILAAAGALAGCALLSTPDPVGLYRFGDLDPPSAMPPSHRTAVVLNPIGFPQGAAGDRILTAEGGQVSYLAGARWVGPSETLYRAALEAEFLRSGSSISVSDRRSSPRSGPAVDLDISSFEARYLNGSHAAPTVVVSGRARIVGPDRAVRAERTFSVQQPATENRVSAVVSAFDTATAEFNRQVVAWVDANAR